MVARRRTTNELTEHHSGWDWVRVAGVWLLILVAGIAFSSYVAIRWLENSVLQTDAWVSLVGPLPKQPVVSDALGRHIGQQVFDEETVENRVTEALPPRAAFLAGPLTDQLQSLTVRASQRLVAGDAFQTIWEGANRVAMGRLLATARGETPPLQARINERFDVDISDSGDQLRAALGRASAAIPALQPASQKAIDVSIDLKARAARVHQAIRTADMLYAILPLSALAALLSALAISRTRRKTFIAAAITAIVLLLAELIGLKWLRGYVIEQVRRPENLSAVSYIFDVLTAGLRDALILGIGLMALLIVFGWLAGTSAVARRLRSLVGLDRLSGSRVERFWRAFREWIGRYKYIIWLGIFLVVLISLAARQQVSARELIGAMLVTISLWAAVHILGIPRSKPALV